MMESDWLTIVQTIGVPFTVLAWIAFAAGKMWTWYTTVKWPAERSDAQSAATIEREEKRVWYQQMHDLIMQVQKVYLILAVVHPEHARAVDQSYPQERD